MSDSHVASFTRMAWTLGRCRGDGEIGLARKAEILGLKAFYQGQTHVRHRVPATHMTPEISRDVHSWKPYQNPICGGYGVNWNLSCCECIDSIDPLARLLRSSGEYYDQIRGSLERALANAMTAFNEDGGFTFRRGHELAYGDSLATYQGVDESSTFFTWFRILSIALITQALAHGFNREKPRWTWKHVPGHQFWRD